MLQPTKNVTQVVSQKTWGMKSPNFPKRFQPFSRILEITVSGKNMQKARIIEKAWAFIIVWGFFCFILS